MRSLNIVVVAAAVGLILPGHAWAEDAVDLMDRQPTQQELIDALTPAPVIKTRGIKPIGREAEAQEKAIGKVDLAVQFELNSSVLTEETKLTLSTLAGALQSDGLKTFTFMIEGHTDASGADDYNMTLSQRRANSVVDFLVQQHGVNPAQLSPVGKGETDLLNTANPNDGKNRRVRIRNLNAS